MQVGACWPFIAAKFEQFMYGFYPDDQRWRVNLTFVLGALAAGAAADPARALQAARTPSLFFGVFPVVAFFLLVGGVFGLTHVETRPWGGLLVTLVVAFTGIVGLAAARHPAGARAALEPAGRSRFCRSSSSSSGAACR